MTLFLALLAVAQVNSHSTIELPGTTSVSFQSIHGYVVIPSKSGAEEFQSILDTATGGDGVISRELASKLKLKKKGTTVLSDPSGKNNMTVPVYAMPELKVGQITFRNLLIPERPVQMGQPLVLGIHAIRAALLTIDYKKMTVTLSKDPMSPDLAATAADVKYEDEVYTTNINVNGKVVKAHVDTGSPGGVMLPESIAKNLRYAAPRTVIGHARTVMNSFEVMRGQMIGTIKIAGITLKDPVVISASIFPTANVGNHFWKDYRMVLDQRAHKLALIPQS